MKKSVYISVINDLVTDQRVHRIAGTILHSGYRVTLIGRRFSDSKKVRLEDMQLRRFRLIFNNGFLFYASYNIRLFFYLLFRREIKVLVANDLDTLPANYLISRIRRVKLVYDSHEYFTEVPELTGRRFVKNFWTILEKMMVPGVDSAYTVNESLAKMYSVKYGVDFEVVRNVPDKDLDEEEYAIPESYMNSGFLIYQGAVNKDRGLEELIDIVYEIQEFRLIIVGDGDVINLLRKRVSDLNLGDFVYFTGKIEPSKLKSVTRKALLGLSLEKKTNLNYYYALPNKLFDYIRAGIPVLCSDFPEMRKIVDSYRVGRVADPDDRNEIKQLIKLMISDNQRRQEWIKNTRLASEELSWDIEQNQLYGIYKKVGIDLKTVPE